MVVDLLLCFSTSLREHCIYFRVPCSILHCPLPPLQPPSIGLHCPHHLLPGLRSRNIFCILHFHYQSPIPQGTNRGRCPRSGTCCTPVHFHYQKTTLSPSIRDPGTQLTRRGRSYSISIPLLEANRPL